MRQSILVLLVALFPGILLAQTGKFSVSVYFASAKSELTNDGKKTLEALIDSLENYPEYYLTIKGNTDSVGDSSFNVQLSERRVKTVMDYLTANTVSPKRIGTSAFGETKPVAENRTDQGKQKNRRVDILVTYPRPKPAPAPVPVPEQKKETPPPPPADTCLSDTTIYLSQGTQLVFNTCEYLRIKDCLQLEEMLTMNDMILNRQSTMDNYGFPLSSCGMIKIGYKPECGEKCFDKPIVVRFPITPAKECDWCQRSAAFFFPRGDGSWRASNDKKNQIKRVKINGKEYFQFTIYCPSKNRVNCDCRIKATKVKFKTNEKNRFVNVKIGISCPEGLLEYTPGKRPNIVNARIPCAAKEKTVLATVINASGDTLELTPRPLNDLPKRYLFARCGKISDEIDVKIWGMFPIYKKAMYRKYYIKNPVLVPTKK